MTKTLSISQVNLQDPECVWLDEKAKTPGYFCRRYPVHVGPSLIRQLKETSVRCGGKNVRLCLHESPESAFHEMVILEHRGKYYRPHKHLTKSESHHIVEGKMAVFAFDRRGEILDATILEPQGNFLYRVGIDMYHAIMPLSETIVYHETKPGPFLREGDSLYPEWAPDGTDPVEVGRYLERLKGFLG